MDTRYKEGTQKETKVVLLKPDQTFNLGAFWNGEGFVLNSDKDPMLFDQDSDIYIYLSEGIVFGVFKITHDHPFIEKYRAAIESDIIVINISDYDNAGLGDLWNGKEVYSIEGVEK